MTEINDGDTVRIAFEGAARKDSLGRVYVNDQGLFIERASSIEILSKRPPQVGDVIPRHSDQSVYDALPVGTVLDMNDGAGSGRSESFFKAKVGWIYSETGRVYLVANMLAARRVVHIP